MTTVQDETKVLLRKAVGRPASHRRSTTPSRGTLSFDQTFSSYTRTTIDNYQRWTLQAGKWSSVVAAHCSMRVSGLAADRLVQVDRLPDPARSLTLLDSPWLTNPPRGRALVGARSHDREAAYEPPGISLMRMCLPMSSID